MKTAVPVHPVSGSVRFMFKGEKLKESGERSWTQMQLHTGGKGMGKQNYRQRETEEKLETLKGPRDTRGAWKSNPQKTQQDTIQRHGNQTQENTRHKMTTEHNIKNKSTDVTGSFDPSVKMNNLSGYCQFI